MAPKLRERVKPKQERVLLHIRGKHDQVYEEARGVEANIKGGGGLKRRV